MSSVASGGQANRLAWAAASGADTELGGGSPKINPDRCSPSRFPLLRVAQRQLLGPATSSAGAKHGFGWEKWLFGEADLANAGP